MRFPKLELIAFTTGAVIMVIEILGSRILGPYFGTSIVVWSAIIGIVLAAMSLGYYLGGRIVDRFPDHEVLFWVLCLSSLSILLISLFKDAILLLAAWAGVGAGALIASFSLFSLPSVLLAMVSPCAVRLKMLKVDTSGDTVGSLYAISTIGSIAGTFLAGFYLIPTFQLSHILFSLSFLLLLLALFCTRKPLLLGFNLLCIALLLGIGFFFVFPGRTPARSGFQLSCLYEKNSAYYTIRVCDVALGSGKTSRYLILDNILQSSEDPETGELTAEYQKYFRLDRFFMPRIRRALFLGGGSYSMVRDLLKRNPAARADVVEIDAEVTRAARRYFNLRSDPRLRIFHQDARAYLNRTAEKYDAIYLDAGFASHLPFHLATQEFFRTAGRALNEDGLFMLNVIGRLERKDRYLRAVHKTLASVFPAVYVFPVVSDNAEDIQNFVLFAMKKEPGTRAPGHYIRDLGSGGAEIPLLTDDHCPVEYLALATDLKVSRNFLGLYTVSD